MYHSEQPNASGTNVPCWLLFLYPFFIYFYEGVILCTN
uniref:Uncharacterized protein n=1 Tax=Siphoviridae sp. cto3L1 TaxID=2827942 RepID=A0A8S5SQH3_9CAUD|nr:MAG TPA: hypothetical protein [Siphoviridae sp. cto3L1]DAI21613.1 MAG TPA: hypothetical protein [Caudoviricetes sp.]